MRINPIQRNLAYAVFWLEIFFNLCLILVIGALALKLWWFASQTLSEAGYPPLDYRIWLALFEKPWTLYAYLKAWAEGTLAAAVALPLGFSVMQGIVQLAKRVIYSW